jgi:hypothetical protein
MPSTCRQRAATHRCRPPAVGRRSLLARAREKSAAVPDRSGRHGAPRIVEQAVLARWLRLRALSSYRGEGRRGRSRRNEPRDAVIASALAEWRRPSIRGLGARAWRRVMTLNPDDLMNPCFFGSRAHARGRIGFLGVFVARVKSAEASWVRSSSLFRRPESVGGWPRRATPPSVLDHPLPTLGPTRCSRSPPRALRKQSCFRGGATSSDRNHSPRKGGPLASWGPAGSLPPTNHNDGDAKDGDLSGYPGVRPEGVPGQRRPRTFLQSSAASRTSTPTCTVRRRGSLSTSSQPWCTFGTRSAASTRSNEPRP